jgi:CheY-like chemotaxis protein
VLIVDDDALMLTLVERMLVGYCVSTARDGREALAVLSTSQDVGLLITDYLMPEMTGRELVNRARKARRDLPVLVLTGHGDTLATADAEWWATEPHVEKPFRAEELIAAVARLIGPSRAAV